MKLTPRLVLSIAVMLVSMSGISIVSIFCVEEIMKHICEHQMAMVARTSMERIDRGIYYRIETCEEFAASSKVASLLERSNLEFERMPERPAEIARRDAEWIDTPKNTLNPLMREIMDDPVSRDLKEKIAFYNAENPEIYGEVFITNRYGVNAAETARTTDYVQNDESWWQEAAREGLSVSRVGLDESTGIYSVTIGLAIPDKEGNLIGVMKIVLGINNVFSLLKETEADLSRQAYPSAHLVLFDDQNNPLYSNESHCIDIHTISQTGGREHARSNDIPAGYTSPNKDHEIVAVVSSVGYSGYPGKGWSLMLAADAREVLAPVRSARHFLLIVLLAGLIVSVGTGLVLARLIVNPLKRLRDIAISIGMGNLDVEIEVPKPGNEISDLTLALSAMAHDLKRMIHTEKELSAKTALFEAEQQKSREMEDARAALEKALAELRETQDRLISQERFEALGRMANGVAHDFNNALAPIIGFSELLLERPETLKDREKAVHHLTLIHTAAKDAANVVKRLRDFYRNSDPNETESTVDMNEVVDLAVELARPRWKDQPQAEGRSISLKTALTGDPAAVIGRHTELREVIINLISNAADAINKQGTIDIRTFTEEDNVVVEIRDDGFGMTEDIRGKCTEPFFSTKGTAGGTGLGLSFSLGVIKRHGGRLEIESGEGSGTTARVFLPAAVRQQQAEKKTDTAVACRTRLSVLVADDEEHIRDFATECLSGWGHEVETSSNGNEALEKFKTKHYDLLITDRAMPGMNGDQIAREVKGLCPETPVIMLTGFGDIMSAHADKIPDVDIVLGKPISVDRLSEAVERSCRIRSGDIS